MADKPTASKARGAKPATKKSASKPPPKPKTQKPPAPSQPGPPPPPTPLTPDEERTWAMLSHLSVLLNLTEPKKSGYENSCEYNQGNPSSSYGAMQHLLEKAKE